MAVAQGLHQVMSQWNGDKGQFCLSFSVLERRHLYFSEEKFLTSVFALALSRNLTSKFRSLSEFLFEMLMLAQCCGVFEFKVS